MLNRYEAMVILPESLTEEEIESGLDALSEEIKGLGGTAGKAARMGRKPFARPLKKQTAGEYALLRFELAGEQVTPLLEKLKFHKPIFRIQVSRLEEQASA